MNRIWSILVLVAAMLAPTGLSPTVAHAAAPSESELKEQFRERNAALQRLKDAGKVGETTEGLIEPVRSGYGGEDVKLPDRTIKVSAFVQEENADRKDLYRLIGERTGEPTSEVAQQAALRHFRQASADHWLKLRNGQWAQKKDLPAPE